jgi:AraC-like DNA-binding protein
MHQDSLPEGVHLFRQKLHSKSIPSGRPRVNGNSTGSLITARWPEDGLETKRSPVMVCVIDGQADFAVGQEVLRCKEATFILCPPGVPHSSGLRSHLEQEQREHGSADLLWFILWGRDINVGICHSRGERHYNDAPGEDCVIVSDYAAQLFNMMFVEATSQTVGHEKVCASLLLAFLHILRRKIEEGQFFCCGSSQPDFGHLSHLSLLNGTARQSLQWNPVEQAKEFIRLHLSESLTLEKVARAIYMSRTQFAKRFHDETGQTFLSYVTACRLEKGKKLLRDTEWPIARISAVIGLSTSSFRILLHKDTGASPSEYREMSRAMRQAE